jgi:hypothetical protein
MRGFKSEESRRSSLLHSVLVKSLGLSLLSAALLIVLLPLESSGYYLCVSTEEFGSCISDPIEMVWGQHKEFWVTGVQNWIDFYTEPSGIGEWQPYEIWNDAPSYWKSSVWAAPWKENIPSGTGGCDWSAPSPPGSCTIYLVAKDRDSGATFRWQVVLRGETPPPPPPGENHPPTVTLSYSVENPTPNEAIYHFQAEASDPDGDTLTYKWYVNGAEQAGATEPSVQWSNPPAGTYTVKVVVSDGKGGTAEDSVEISVGVAVEFARLETGKAAYAPGDTVKVIYEVTNPGTTSADYHVEYVILDSSGEQVYNFVGEDHTIAPGATDAWQSAKWAIPADAAQGSYEVQARCISEGGIDEESASFKVVSEEIEVSYTLGYDMPMSESEPVALRVRFKIKDESSLQGIVSISISKQEPEIFFRYPARPPSDPLNRVEYGSPGVKDAQYDFYVVRLIEQKQSVSFIALLEVVNEIGELEEREVPFTVYIEAAFTVYATKMGRDVVGHPTPPLLNGNPLALDQWTKGQFGEKLTIPVESRVVMRELSGASYAIEHRGGSADTYWDLTLGPWNLQQLRDYQMEEASATRMTLEKIGADKSLDKTLEVLFKKYGTKAAGPLGIILDILGGSPANPSTRAVIRLRSTMGLTVAASGDVAVRNFEGAPEIIQPDGSVLSLPVGNETTMGEDGSFAAPTPYDPSNPSVLIWADEIGQPPPSGTKTIEQAIDTNGNGTLEDNEILTAIQYWISGEAVPGTEGKMISDAEMLRLIQLWISGEPVSGASASATVAPASGSVPLAVEAISLYPNPLINSRGATIEVHGSGIAGIELQVFNLAGQLVFDERTSGNRLVFQGLDERSRQSLANGVYLYAVTARGFDDQVRRTEVKKLVVLR